MEHQTIVGSEINFEMDKDPRSPIVVCAADNNYAMQLAVVGRSIVTNLAPDRRVHLHIIDGGITTQNKQKIVRSIGSDRCAISWLQPRLDALTNVPVSGHLNFTTYLRLLIPDLIPAAVEKVIYLDSDLIVNADLGKLWEMSIGEYPLLAVQETLIPYVSSPRGLSNYAAIGISPDAKYFNAGVLVINLAKWRQENLGLKILDYIAHNREHIRYHDQDAMNAVLAQQWGELDPRWNQTPGIFKLSSWQDSPFGEATFDQVLRDPYIIHFATSAKPWNSREVYPANALFFQYVDQTAWAGWRFNLWRRLGRRLQREIKALRSNYGTSRLNKA